MLHGDVLLLAGCTRCSAIASSCACSLAVKVHTFVLAQRLVIDCSRLSSLGDLGLVEVRLRVEGEQADGDEGGQHATEEHRVDGLQNRLLDSMGIGRRAHTSSVTPTGNNDEESTGT